MLVWSSFYYFPYFMDDDAARIKCGTLQHTHTHSHSTKSEPKEWIYCCCLRKKIKFMIVKLCFSLFSLKMSKCQKVIKKNKRIGYVCRGLLNFNEHFNHLQHTIASIEIEKKTNNKILLLFLYTRVEWNLKTRSIDLLSHGFLHEALCFVVFFLIRKQWSSFSMVKGLKCHSQHFKRTI